MKHKVDLNHWDRLDSWSFMRTLNDSWYSVTSEVDCTKALTHAKSKRTSFFIKYLYSLLRAANEVKEFGYRANREGGVDWFDRVDGTVPVAVPGKTFYTVLVPFIKDYTTFYNQTKQLLSSVPTDGNPFELNKCLLESGNIGVVNISATPRLFFTSMTYTSGNEWPLMNVGKAVEREGRWIMPVAVCVDHAFVDGNNIADFLERLQHYLDLD